MSFYVCTSNLHTRSNLFAYIRTNLNHLNSLSKEQWKVKFHINCEILLK